MADFNLEDFFGANNARPDHPDFWKLSEIILSLDGAMQEGLQEGKEVDDVISEKASEIGDSYSIVYMATQRAMRLHGAVTLDDLQRKMDDVLKSSIIYLEGLIVGARLEHSRFSSQPPDSSNRSKGMDSLGDDEERA